MDRMTLMVQLELGRSNKAPLGVARVEGLTGTGRSGPRSGSTPRRGRRAGRALVLTEEGQILYAGVGRALRILRDTVDRLDRARSYSPGVAEMNISFGVIERNSWKVCGRLSRALGSRNP